MGIFFLGNKELFSFFGINPKKLNRHQAEQTAILFLHGARHNQSGVLPLASRLKNAGISPVFTLNFHSKSISPDEYQEQLLKKILHIRKLYSQKGKEVTLNIIGHSRGAFVGAYFAYCLLPQQPQLKVSVKKVIAIAAPWHVMSRWQNFHSPLMDSLIEAIHENESITLYNIMGDKDWMTSYEQKYIMTDKKHTCIIKNKSHLSILYSMQAHDKIINWLES